MNTTESNSLDVARRVLRQQDEELNALRVLLDRHLGDKDQLLVKKTMMGGTDAYLASVSLRWLAERVSFASELPLFREKIDPASHKIIIDETTIELIQQRPVDWSRQAPLTQYLAARKNHKFPPILAVISHHWIDQPDSDEWNAQGRALRPSAEFNPLDSDGTIGLLDVSERVSIYALDGQHRLMAVQGLMELIKSGSIPRLKKDKKPMKDGLITVDNLVKEYGISRSEIQALAEERIGIELITGVMAGESREEARRRVRSIFVHVNRMAAPLTQGQLDTLNEDDGFAIVARTVATRHPYLKGGDDNERRVEWDQANLSERSTPITTLKTLHEMAKAFLGAQTFYKHWNPEETGLIPRRPDDEDLARGANEFSGFWDRMAQLPSLAKIARGESPAKMRKFGDGEGHLLFRPVGQVALAEAIGSLLPLGQDLDTIFQKVAQFDLSGGFKMDTPQSLWWMVLYDPNKQRMVIRGAKLAKRLLEYMLGGGIADTEKREKLRADLADSRTIQVGQKGIGDQLKEHTGQAIGFDGEWVAPEKIELPPALRSAPRI